MKNPNFLEKKLGQLAELVRQQSFEELETDMLEIKPVPPDRGSWDKLHESVCAFLNTRGGVLVLGVKEVAERNSPRRYVFTGWTPNNEQNVRQIADHFTDYHGKPVQIEEALPPPQILDFLEGQIAVLFVNELSAERKFVFYRGKARKRLLTGDAEVSPGEIERQEEFKQESIHARELQLVPSTTAQDIDLDKLNDYITHLNQPIKVETIKPDLASAIPFLERKCFLKNGQPTTLGILVCGNHPEDLLHFRCHVHGYVDVPQEVARDKQDLVGNILPLMERSLAYTLRNIQVGVSIDDGGSSRPQYPEGLLRETVNNALAHRDYSIDRQVIIAIKPGMHIEISNPGSFRNNLRIERLDGPIRLRRILPEAKARNPRLADVLRVFRKWEGRGYGMATLVDLCLQNEIDLPYYQLRQDEVSLFLCAGRLLDQRMKRLFQAFDGYIAEKLNGDTLSDPQKVVLAYLIKSEWANELARYTILLTPGNNHSGEVVALERAGLVTLHDASSANYPIYIAARELMRTDYRSELRAMFGLRFDALDPLSKQVLDVVYRFNHFSKARFVSAKLASFSLWPDHGSEGDIKAFDAFYRRVRSSFNRLEQRRFVRRSEGRKGYLLDDDGAGECLKPPTKR